jgi:hypothetical protein
MNFNINIVILALTQITLISCESHEQPSESAFIRVRKEKFFKLDSAANVAEEQERIEPIETLLTEKITDSWTHFKLETGRHLDKNDRAILKIKHILDLSVSSFKKATVLENENTDLRMSLNKFDDSDKEVQDKFKTKMKADLDKLDADIELLSTKYKTQI